MTSCLGAVLALASFAAAVNANGPDTPLDAVKIDPETGLFVDGHGRVRIFHGVNVVSKQAPWYPPSSSFSPEDSLDSETMDLLQKWGFNVVRLGVMWPGVEPVHGQVDQVYMNEMARLSSELAKRGVYTLVDLHQDVGSRRFCGEGFPEHYIDALQANPYSDFAQAAPFPRPMEMNITSFPIPSLQDCTSHNFAAYYMTDRVGAMWGELYKPGSDLNNGFIRYWQTIAKAFGQAPHVLAYELLNEPSGLCLGGSKFSCTDIPDVIGNEVEVERLMPLYQAAAAAIREIDGTKPILYEPTTPPKLVPGQVFPEPVLGNDTQQGLAYHIYCAPGDGDTRFNGVMCHVAQDVFENTYFDFFDKYKSVAGFLTEFGAIGGNPNELDHLNSLLAFADSKFQSWAYWMLKMFGDFTTENPAQSLWDHNGNVEVPKLRALSRTYAPAIGGTPVDMSFDPASGAFKLEFVATVEEAPTEVYLNKELNYPDGFDLIVNPVGCLEQQQVNDPNRVHLSLPKDAACKGSTVSVEITRREADSIVVI